MKKITVASRNPVKINAAGDAWKKLFPEITVNLEGMDSPSLVADQPWGESETRQGAFNRLKFIRRHDPHADLWISIEGGCKQSEWDNAVTVFGWVFVHDGVNLGQAKTAEFNLPEIISQEKLSHKELGDLCDEHFKTNNSKQGEGAIGLLTHGVINRQDYYTHAMILAMLPLYQPELYALES